LIAMSFLPHLIIYVKLEKVLPSWLVCKILRIILMRKLKKSVLGKCDFCDGGFDWIVFGIGCEIIYLIPESNMPEPPDILKNVFQLKGYNPFSSSNFPWGNEEILEVIRFEWTSCIVSKIVASRCLKCRSREPPQTFFISKTGKKSLIKHRLGFTLPHLVDLHLISCPKL
jgi:hypothetical protein